MDERLLKLMAKKYPNRKSATGEIINLRAVLALPKGTEYFFSDLHGEYEAFVHMLKSASGVIKSKIDEIFAGEMDDEEREQLASLIYNAKAELRRRKAEEPNFNRWCYKTIYRLIQVCKSVSTKYTRSKVRKQLPEYWGASMDELLHADDEANRAHYYGEIITSVIESGMAENFIAEMAATASKLAIDKLHIIGDIWDRGAHPDQIMDYLMEYNDIDFQWGNHDIVWMGAATGNWACITNILRMNISYNNFDMLEVGYGFNLRALSQFAQEVYGDDPCEFFKPKVFENSKFDPVSEALAAKMHKAIAICQFKVEGQRIMEHPEYGLEHRLLLDKIDFDRGTIDLHGVEYELRDKNLPTVDPGDPYKLTEGEERMLRALEASVLHSRLLQKHIRFLFSHGALYKVQNNNLFFHGCLPMDEDGNFVDCTVNGHTYKGKAYMDYLDDQIRKSFFDPEESDETGHQGDLMWYMWLSSKSPLFGKDQMTTFERLFIADKATHKEHTVPYYRLINEREHCETILKEFGLDPGSGHILNGHVPVKIKDGESPVKGGGKLIVIDGGISKAYQKTTGIAGYTFIYNSRFMALAEHQHYEPMRADGSQVFHAPTIRTLEVLPKRMMVSDTDQADEINEKIEALRALVEAYKHGTIKEVY
ncbi:MAG: fructose-1,6-bisphosphatase [Anaerovoracaceae bacterium]|jgi:fructose-1,6-bisphosphatase-3